MRPTFWDHVRAAFSARPLGMFVPPNWVGLAAFGLRGATVDPGFWVLGAGLEMGYLALLATNPRFQRTVSGARASERASDWARRVDALAGRLSDRDRRRYAALAARCRAVVTDQQTHEAEMAAGVQAQAEGLGRLTWMYLRLLLTRQAIDRILREPGAERDVLQDRIHQLQARMDEPGTTDDLRRSLAGQVDILRERLARQAEGAEKLTFIDAELTRIEEQVHLIREQAVLSSDPQTLSQRIDEVAATLGGTGRWIREQQQIYGAMEDLLIEPPPLPQEAGSEGA